MQTQCHAGGAQWMRLTCMTLALGGARPPRPMPPSPTWDEGEWGVGVDAPHADPVSCGGAHGCIHPHAARPTWDEAAWGGRIHVPHRHDTGLGGVLSVRLKSKQNKNPAHQTLYLVVS